MRKVLWIACAVVAGGSAWAQFPTPVLRQRAAAVDQLRSVQPGVRFFEQGNMIQRVYGAPFGGGFTYEDAAIQFAREYAALFNVDEGEFQFTRIQPIMDGRFTAAYFQETLEGIPVERGHLTVLMKESLGKPIVLASASGKAVRGPLPKPVVAAQSAIAKVRAIDPDLTEFGAPGLVVWMGEETQHLAWKFLAQGRNTEKDCNGCQPIQYKAVTYFVDAVTGQILHRQNEIYDVDVTGSVKGWAQPGQNPDWPANPETLQPMPHLLVQISGGNSAYTDINGNFTIPNAGTGAVTVTAGMNGRWCNVVPAQGTLQTNSQSVTPPGPVNFVKAADLAQFNVAQINAYIHVNRVHDYVKAQNAAYPGVDVPLTTNVNQASSCNANFNSGNMTINFFHEAGGCVNTAYSSVVHHEYGHFIINRAGTAQGGYGEGMSDTVSCLLADDPRLGLEFQGQGTGPIRHAVNTIHWPENAGSPIHTAGMMVSGAFWETVLKMDTTIGHTAGLNLMRNYSINSILLNPPGIDPGLTIDVLTLDDNDGNLNNGTPNYDDIAFGFGKKGLTAPPVTYLTITPISVPGTFVQFLPGGQTILFKLKVKKSSTEPNIGTAKLFYRVNGGSWQQQSMNNYNDAGSVAGGIAQPASGSTVDWYVQVFDTANHEVLYPTGGASSPNSFIVASQLQTIFTDTFETAQPWTVTNTSVTSGAWQRGDPFGTTNSGAQAAPENDSNDAGLQCMVTQLGSAGQSAGSHDVDGGPTDLDSPAFNLSGADGIIDYSRWFYSANGTPDSMVVQISNNNGASWVTVETISGSGNNSWIRRSFRVGQYVAPTATIKIRFRAVDNPNDSVTEAGVDNVVVRKIVP